MNNYDITRRAVSRIFFPTKQRRDVIHSRRNGTTPHSNWFDNPIGAFLAPLGKSQKITGAPIYVEPLLREISTRRCFSVLSTYLTEKMRYLNFMWQSHKYHEITIIRWQYVPIWIHWVIIYWYGFHFLYIFFIHLEKYYAYINFFLNEKKTC